MKRKEIQNLIDDVMISENCLGDFHIVFKFLPDEDMCGFTAYVRILKGRGCKTYADGVLMAVNRKEFMQKSDDDIIYQKVCILHELGHVFTHSCRHSRREYRAQKWAYNKAVELGMCDVADKAKEIIKDWQCSSKGNRYYKAYLIAKKSEFI